jgi:modification methylase
MIRHRGMKIDSLFRPDAPDALIPDRIIIGDCVDVMRRLPAGSVDLVFADPPYNLQLRGPLTRPDQSRVDAVDEDWDRIGDFQSYDRFCEGWLAECRRLLADDGAMWVIGTYHNIFRIGRLMQDMGFWLLNDVVWRKANPMPNFRGRRLTNAHETLIWAAKSRDSRYLFNYATLKALNDDVQMRSDWYLPLCTGGERLKDGDGRKLHPTQKPEALLHRVLLASSRPGQVVLDPFLGTGTTGVVARRLGRRFIGIERDPNYAEAAEARIAEVEPVPNELTSITPSRRDAPRVPFGHLVERGLVPAGTILFSDDRRHAARVKPDGTLIADRVAGSIHQVAAELQGLAACNGWSFWWMDRQGRAVPIDALREQIRAEMRQLGSPAAIAAPARAA